MHASHLGCVRPTLRALDDLGLGLPTFDVSLCEIEHSLIEDAQRLPALELVGGLERIQSLKDRIWFKVKTGSFRGAVTRLQEEDVPKEFSPTAPEGRWWLGAAGSRKQDTPRQDFYARLAESAKREAKGTGDSRRTCTDSLLPVTNDWKRLTAEAAIRWRRHLQAMVVEIIAESMRTHRMVEAEYRHHRVMAFVHAPADGEAYLAIGAEGVPDPTVIALILDSVPGIDPSDWMPEPSSEHLDISPSSGEIVYSTLLPPAVASSILDLDEADD